jgi:hypothetical protein
MMRAKRFSKTLVPTYQFRTRWHNRGDHSMNSADYGTDQRFYTELLSKRIRRHRVNETRTFNEKKKKKRAALGPYPEPVHSSSHVHNLKTNYCNHVANLYVMSSLVYSNHQDTNTFFMYAVCFYP